ncbi:MAG TPA: flagellar biosynthesis anti-sigma factor FlgM [Terracidiphilus sp.]|jgi:flagellar biosynthesis anti-sigma factor FlgM
MDIRNDAEALKTFLGISPSPAEGAHPVRSDATSRGAGAAQAAFAGDQATFSRAGTEVSHATDPSAVRMEKVTAIQQALASGTYNVPASMLAGKVINAMLVGSDGSLSFAPGE